MLMSQSSSFFYPPIKPHLGKYCSNKNLPFSTNIHLKMNSSSTKSDVVHHKRHSCFTSRCHLNLPTTAVEADSIDLHAGIGILEFFEGKNVLVTGATGFLGKVMVEKILRSTSAGKIYLLIKAKDKDDAVDRLKREIIRSELLTCVEEKYEKYYEEFTREKLIPIAGDIREPNLGMDQDSMKAVRRDVHVIIHSAASTTFDERYDWMVDANVIAPQRVVRFAKTCPNLHLLTHLSTAYVCGSREGIILEKPLIMGDTGRIDGGDDAHGRLDVADEISLLLKSSTHHHHNPTNYFKKLGQERAEKLGWSTTYQLSKAMGEMVVNEIRGDVPLLIIRPAVVESCYCQPLPGWIQGNRMFDPVAISYGKGMLPAYFADAQVPLDFIPADFVANTMIAAIAKHGKRDGDGDGDEVNVYHVASSISNPITFFHAFEYLYEYFKAAPLVENANIAKVEFFNDFDEFSRYTRQQVVRCNGTADEKMIRRCDAIVKYAEQLCKIYEFAGFFKARFDTSNTKKLIEEMSKEEQTDFEVDIKNIDWKKYFLESHLPGLKKHVINSARAS